MSAAGLTWGNTFGPLTLLVLIAVALPFAAVPRATRSQWRLALGILLAALGALAAALALFAWLYAGEGAGRVTVLRAAGLSALAWGPFLALSWLVRAQAVEKRKGEDMAREGKE